MKMKSSPRVLLPTACGQLVSDFAGSDTARGSSSYSAQGGSIAAPSRSHTGSAPIPVLLMARDLDWGGIERDVSKFARHLSQYGVAPHVACFHPGGIRWREIESAGIPVVGIPVASFKSRSVIAGAGILRTYLREHRIQVVHAFDPAANVFGVLLARMLGIPVTLASQLCFRDLYSLKTRVLQAVVDRVATGLFVNCHAVGDDLSSTWWVPTQRIQVCHNGFEEEEFHPNHRRRPGQLADASVVIGTVAVLREEKNLTTLIDAFAQVAQVDRQAKLLIVGSGPMKPFLERRVQELNLGTSCRFEAASSTPAEWMRAIDIFVLSSRSEAFPNALLEAMACGCCPVASRIGGVPELIRHNERGVLFDAGNTRELADALCMLALDRNRRKALACAAGTFVRQHLTIEVAASRLAGIYRQMLQHADE